MERLDKPDASKKSANMTFHVDKASGNEVLKVTDAAIGYDDKILAQPINLDVRKWMPCYRWSQWYWQVNLAPSPLWGKYHLFMGAQFMAQMYKSVITTRPIQSDS